MCFASFSDSGNEDYRTWNTFNTLLVKTCPSLSFVENSHASSKFMFISDRDKGLDKSLSKIFPRYHPTNGVHHTKQNVKTQFGPNAAEMVFPIATAFSKIQEETLLEQLKTKSASAYDYLVKILWITTQKLPPQQKLLPQYGMVISNTSECINSMIDDYRSDGCTDLLEGILQKMMEKISENRQLYKAVDRVMMW